ncbi:hypothetical protein ACAI80_004288 [Salmonella enterica]
MYKRWKEITENYKYLSAVDKETIDNLMEQLDDSISLLAIRNHFHGNENNVIKFARLNNLDDVRKENSHGIVNIDTRLNGIIKHVKKAVSRSAETMNREIKKYNVRKLLEAME